MTEEMDATVRDWSDRLDRADALFQKGNITGAAALVRAVEDEAEAQRKQRGIGSAQRRECMRILKRARATFERFEFAAGIDDEEGDEEDD